MCIGQRTDAPQLWLEWRTSTEGMPDTMLSLVSDSVDMVVRSLKAALQFHLDWREEIEQKTSETTLSYLRQKCDAGELVIMRHWLKDVLPNFSHFLQVHVLSFYALEAGLDETFVRFSFECLLVNPLKVSC